MHEAFHQQFSVAYSFPVLFTRDVFAPGNLILRNTLRGAGPGRHRALLVVDSNVGQSTAALFDRCRAYAAAHSDVLEWVGSPLIVRGGEICKSEPVEVAALHALVEQHRIDRQSFVITIGGGAVLDAMGYAAATAHRGVRLIRMPTTTLSQNDAGVGVKNGINAFGRKNFLGTFAPPFAVINDFEFLRTLPARELRSGMAEAVKVAAIKDADFLHWMRSQSRHLAAFEPSAVEQLIHRCARLHIDHVAGADPFEQGSARPLDFGHWSAHHLEELAGTALRHGEAVAIGCALDASYAARLGLLSEPELEQILLTLEELGFALWHPALPAMDLAVALGQFREHLGGELCLTLPDGLGRKIEVREVDLALMRRCILALESRALRHQESAALPGVR